MVKQTEIRNLAQSLAGSSVRPAEDGNFSGVVAVPAEYFAGGATEREALVQYLNDTVVTPHEFWPNSYAASAPERRMG